MPGTKLVEVLECLDRGGGGESRPCAHSTSAHFKGAPFTSAHPTTYHFTSTHPMVQTKKAFVAMSRGR